MAVRSNWLNLDCQSEPSSDAIRLLTNSHPIEGASACRLASSSAYSGGKASGMVDNIWATFIRGPLSEPKASRSSAACLSLLISTPR